MKTILVVDDEPMLLTTTMAILAQEGYYVVGRDNGQSAIDYIENDKGQEPNLILTDLDMPHIDGFGLREYCKANNIITPMILMTGNASLATAIEAKKRGFVGFIAKPFQVDDLLLEINSVLEGRE